MRVALYCRVSTEEQTTDNQLVPLRNLCKGMGWDIVNEYIEYASGGDSNRPVFKQLMDAADSHQFDLILVWALDRFSREGILNTLAYLKRLRRVKVALKSLQEGWLDTTDEGLGELLLAIFSWVAKQERLRISERTKQGLRKAKNVGKRGKDRKPRKKSGYNLRWVKQRGG